MALRHARKYFDFADGETLLLQLLQVARNAADEFFVQASKVITLNACIAEGYCSLDDVLELARIGEAAVLADNFEEQPRVATGNLELGQEIVQDGFRDFL